MADVDRIPTGVDGLDELIQGGVPEQSVFLVSGGAGCGKTIFGLQYLMEGVENDENCLFISLEEAVEDIVSDAAVFGWDIEDAENITVNYVRVRSGESNFLDKVYNMIQDTDADRIVIDSISIMLGTYGGNEADKRNTLYDLLEYVQRSDATTLLTSEIREADTNTLSRYNVAEFVVDGVIRLYYEGIAEGTFRNAEVRKMRRTAHTPGTYPFKIEDDGIIIRTDSSL